MEMIRVRIYRFDPEIDRAPRYETFDVPHEPWMRVLDVLDYVHEQLAVDIAYRWLCGVKRCGTCAVTVNGSPALACWEPAQPEMTIEPLRNLPVIRDLVTEREPFENALAAIDPLLRRKAPYAGFPEPLSSAAMARASTTRDCIQCLACYAACPVIADGTTRFAGPALLVALAELALDPRDSADRARTAGEHAQVFACVSCYECERVCPMEIPVVRDAIEPLKRQVYARGDGAGAEHARVFLDVVKDHGCISAPQLVRRTKGLSLDALGTGFRMIARGKVSPVQALLGKRAPGAATIRKLYERAEDGPMRADDGPVRAEEDR
jgi:succinate dehydrogenase/fumarate reductase iron-sulfur protein